MVIPASQGTAIFEHGSRGRIRTADHRVKACCRNRLATRLCLRLHSWPGDVLRALARTILIIYDYYYIRWPFQRVAGSYWQLRELRLAKGNRNLSCGPCRASYKATNAIHFLIWRTGWDSNPRMLSHRRFSRPLPSSSRQPVLWDWVLGNP